MTYHSHMLQWTLCEDEDTWQELTAQNPNVRTVDSAHEPQAIPGHTHHWLLSATLFAVVLVSLLGAYLYRQARAGLALVESELTTAVETESWAVFNGSLTVAEGVLDPAAPAVWRGNTLREVEQIGAGSAGRSPLADVRPLLFGDGVALVQVRRSSAAGPVYVEHRFYRETEDGWIRTTPRPALWGPMRLHETRFFRFHYRRRDTVAVATVAGRIDAIYASLCEELGLAPPDDTEKLAIYVTVPESPQLDMLSIYFVGDGLEVPSPALLPLQEDATPAQALEQIIHQALIQYLFQKREVWLGIRRPWSLLLEGMRIWRLQQASHSAAWYTDRLRWLYTEWPAIRGGERALRAGEADWLCQVSTGGAPLIAIWLLSDDCGDENPAQLLKMMPRPPQHLVDVVMMPGIPASQEYRVVHWQRRAVLTSIVDYGVTTYGRQTLPMLLQAMAVHDDWEALIPAVYGVSAEEFEAGWQASLGR